MPERGIEPPFISFDDLVARLDAGATYDELTDAERDAFMGYVADLFEAAKSADE